MKGEDEGVMWEEQHMGGGRTKRLSEEMLGSGHRNFISIILCCFCFAGIYSWENCIPPQPFHMIPSVLVYCATVKKPWSVHTPFITSASLSLLVLKRALSSSNKMGGFEAKHISRPKGYSDWQWENYSIQILFNSAETMLCELVSALERTCFKFNKQQHRIKNRINCVRHIFFPFQ